MIPGWATRDPEKLCPCIRLLYYKFIARFAAREVWIATIETMRDLERQKWYVETHVSRTLKSLHLPQPPLNLALAFDVAPRAYLDVKGWNPGGLVWDEMGAEGHRLGLQWGGDWVTFRDRPHFQLPKCQCR
jgi:peptidoglycan L-alanyl-D-glutamate endopeptidase CwlK